MNDSARQILLAREKYYPSTIGEIYNPNHFYTDVPLLRDAHERNDEILERIYIGRRFRNDTERLEKLFALYAQEKKGNVHLDNASSGARRRV